MDTRKYIEAGLALLLLVILANSCKVPKQESLKNPNIVFIMTDDHGTQALSCYDGRYNRTPNLDRIANEGVMFTRSYVSNSICAPSRAVMLTGKHSHENCMINNSLTFDGTQQTFPKLLQETGYQTALIGKWHLGSNPTGFDYWNILPGQGQYYNPDFIEMGEQKRAEGYATTLITDFALDWLDRRDAAKPFCLLVHHKAPHRTWMPDTTHLDLFEDENFTLPDTYFDDYKGRQAAAGQKMSIIKDMDLVYDLKMLDYEGEIQTRYRKSFEGQVGRMNSRQREKWDAEYLPRIREFKKAGLKGKELAEWKYRRYMTDYLRTIASVDENVGRLLEYLEENRLLENTVIIYTSDQGFYLGEHGWFDKRFMYEESFRTPLMIRLPWESRVTGEVRQLVQNIDLAPTILDLAGVGIPEDMQGLSLKPLMIGDPPGDWRKALYYHYYEYPNEHMVKRHYGIRTGSYKLIHFYYDIDTWEFFDLEKDPQEMHNLIGDPEYTVFIDSLKKELYALKEYYHDTIINKP